MSKLDRIRHFLNENKAGLAIVSDPVTVNYLTGFDCDPHERQMFLFVYENREPALFVPALEVARASAVLDFPVFGYVDSENPWQKIKAGLASTDSPIIYAEFDNLNVTKFQGLQTVFDGRFENLTPFIQKCALSSQLMKFKKCWLPVIMLIKLLISVSTISLSTLLKQTSVLKSNLASTAWAMK